jgi:hypothetical protein
MIALAVFVIALHLAIEALEPTGGWLVTLAVLSGVDVFTGGGLGGRMPLRPWVPFWIGGRHRWAVGLTLFIIALLLAIDAMEPEPPWLVTIAVLSGIPTFVPRRSGRRSSRGRRWSRRVRAWTGGSWSDDDDW